MGELSSTLSIASPSIIFLLPHPLTQLPPLRLARIPGRNALEGISACTCMVDGHETANGAPNKTRYTGDEVHRPSTPPVRPHSRSRVWLSSIPSIAATRLYTFSFCRFRSTRHGCNRGGTYLLHTQMNSVRSMTGFGKNSEEAMPSIGPVTPHPGVVVSGGFWLSSTLSIAHTFLPFLLSRCFAVLPLGVFPFHRSASYPK